MEGLGINSGFWLGKRVFLTGHTGFKGGWLALWLQSMGAQVYGYALNPPTEPNFYTIARIKDGVEASFIKDVRDITAITGAMQSASPDIVFHLAAQPLVRYSYVNPVETYAVNVMGTINLLEAARLMSNLRAIVVITSDKCYENRESIRAYSEGDHLGGHDPYSSSKACAEILTSAWQRSYLEQNRVAVATARAGNVVGGGDWAPDRLIPDFMRACFRHETLQIRFPEAVRPWQHVLEPLSGYLKLAEHLVTEGCSYAEAWNFGPFDEGDRSVRWIVERLVSAYPGTTWEYERGLQPHEARYLKLDSSKAHTRLGWRPLWSLETALDKTVQWYSDWRKGEDMRAVSLAQIAEYIASRSGQ